MLFPVPKYFSTQRWRYRFSSVMGDESVMGDVAPLIPMWFWSNNHRRKGQGDKKQVMGNRLWVIGKNTKHSVESMGHEA
jgi:hypothetical protein